MSKDERFLTMAMGVAALSECKFKMGALVVVHGRIRGASPNLYKNNPKNVHHKFCQVHCEIAAMRKAGWPRRATIYVARINRFSDRRLAKPCVNCQTVLDEFKVRIVYTLD